MKSEARPQGKGLKQKLVALVAVLTLGIAGSAVMSSSRAGADGPWPADTTTTYQVDWRTRTSANVAVEGRAELGSDIRTEGELVVHSYGLRNGSTLLSVKFGKLGVAEAVAMGRPLAPSDDLKKQLLEADAVVSMEGAGTVRDIRFSRSTTPLARTVLRALVLEMCAQIAPSSGDGEVETALGRANVTHATDGNTVTTSRTRYSSLVAFPDGVDPSADGKLDAHGKVEMSAEHAVRSIHGTEEIVIGNAGGAVEGFQSRTELTATLSERKKTPSLSAPEYAPDAPQKHKEGDNERAESLRRRSMGVTGETVFSDVRVASLLPKQGATAWIWHDSAFLELHPEEAPLLLDRASKSLDLNGQAAAFDIVVISGTPAAQSALLSAMRSWAGASEPSYIVLIQRLGFLRHPTAEMLAFVASERTRLWGTDQGRACAFALGALAAAAREKDLDAAKAIVASLAADLQKATLDADRDALVRALGNAGFESSLDAILSQRASESADVRVAVATALRRIQGRRTQDALLGMVVDQEPRVAREALESLFRRPLDADGWTGLHKAFDQGQIPKDAYETLLSGLSAKRHESPEVIGLLVAIVASPAVDSQVRQRAESVLRAEGKDTEETATP
jgi:hypothetical protein